MERERISHEKTSRVIQSRSDALKVVNMMDNRSEKNQNYLSTPIYQRVSDDEDETMQGKFDSPLQRIEDEEDETLQGKFDSPLQKKNETGMPDNLKAGIENLSGFSMDDVRVHYNSSKPATVQALAYTQGTDIHIAPGQEKHLPHEAWHVAQQMAGRVSPTTNINGMPVNDNAELEHEADVMGEKAVGQRKSMNEVTNNKKNIKINSVQFIRLRPDEKETKRRDVYNESLNISYDNVVANIFHNDDPATWAQEQINLQLRNIRPDTRTATIKKKTLLQFTLFFNEYKTGVYNGEKVDREFVDLVDFQHQAAQDFCLYMMNNSELIGVKQTYDDFSFSTTDYITNKSGLDTTGISLSKLKKTPPNPLIVYRTYKLKKIMPTGGIINIFSPSHSHGGSLGAALSHYKPSPSDDFAIVQVTINNITEEEWALLKIKSRSEGDDAKTESETKLPQASPSSGNGHNQFSLNFSSHKQLMTLYYTHQSKFELLTYSKSSTNQYTITDGNKNRNII